MKLLWVGRLTSIAISWGGKSEFMEKVQRIPIESCLGMKLISARETIVQEHVTGSIYESLCTTKNSVKVG